MGCPGQGAASGPSLGGSCSAWGQPSSGPCCEDPPRAQRRVRAVLSMQHTRRHHSKLAVPRTRAHWDLGVPGQRAEPHPSQSGGPEKGRTPCTDPALPTSLSSLPKPSAHLRPTGRAHLLDWASGRAAPAATLARPPVCPPQRDNKLGSTGLLFVCHSARQGSGGSTPTSTGVCASTPSQAPTCRAWRVRRGRAWRSRLCSPWGGPPFPEAPLQRQPPRPAAPPLGVAAVLGPVGLGVWVGHPPQAGGPSLPRVGVSLSSPRTTCPREPCSPPRDGAASASPSPQVPPHLPGGEKVPTLP